MARAKPPFSSSLHMWTCFSAPARLWKLRFDSCRLVELENQILGVEREGDLPGEMIPYVYFDYLRTKEAYRIVPILHHNAIDILTLACLTAIVPWAFRSPEDAPLYMALNWSGSGGGCVGSISREKALVLFRRAIEKGLHDDLLFRTLWDIAKLEKKLGREDAAIAACTELCAVPKSFPGCRARGTRQVSTSTRSGTTRWRWSLPSTHSATVSRPNYSGAKKGWNGG